MSPAAPVRAVAGATTIDATYSCRVRPEHYIDLFASVTLPPVGNRPQPGVLSLTTRKRTVTENGTTTTLSQIGLGATTRNLRIDTSSCRRVKQQIPLSSNGLLRTPRTATPTFFGYFSLRCAATGRVLVRLRVTMAKLTPTLALLGIRRDDSNRRPIAFVRWSPRKVSAYYGTSCDG